MSSTKPVAAGEIVGVSGALGMNRRCGGVDTHGRTHHGAAIDANGRLLGDRQFPASAGGYRALPTPKTRTGPVEALRALRAARRGAVKARVAALNQIHGLIASAPEDLRAGLVDLTRAVLLKRCAGYRIDEELLAEPEHATKAAVRAVARRVLAFDEEITTADRRIRQADDHWS